MKTYIRPLHSAMVVQSNGLFHYSKYTLIQQEVQPEFYYFIWQPPEFASGSWDLLNRT